MGSAVDRARALTPVQRRLALLAAGVAFALDIVDSTIVNLAAPSIQRDLATDAATLQWLVSGYSLCFAMLLIVGGRLGDNYGYRRLFLIGVSAFATASLACGLARTSTELVAARAAQGGAAALMAPQVTSLIQLLFRPHERGPVMGLFGLVGGSSAALGPVLGGLLIHADPLGLGWRAIFLVNLPLAALAAAGGVLAFPPGRAAVARRPDWPGAALLIGGLFLLIYPLVQGREAGWPRVFAALLLLGGALLAALALHLRRLGDAALVPPRLLADRAFAHGVTTSFLIQAALGGWFLTFALTLQMGLRLDVLSASLVTLPFPVGVGCGVAVLARRLTATRGVWLVRAGLAGLALGWAAVVAGLELGLPSPALAPVLFLAGLGMGAATGPLSALALSSTDLAYAGAASGTLTTAQQLGQAFGAALLGALFFTVRAQPAAAARPVDALAWSAGGGVLLLAAAAWRTRGLPASLAPRPSLPGASPP